MNVRRYFVSIFISVNNSEAISLGHLYIVIVFLKTERLLRVDLNNVLQFLERDHNTELVELSKNVSSRLSSN